MPFRMAPATLIGKTCWIDSDEELAFSNHMTRLRLGEGMSPSFVARQLHFLWMSGYMRHRCTHHVNQASISSTTLSQTIPLRVPPSAEQERIMAKLDAMLSRVAAGKGAARRALERLDRYRSAVLQAAVTGELTREWRKTHNPEETGVWYSPGVKANVLFFDKKPVAKTPWTRKLWVYDLRTNKNFTLRQNPIRDEDLADFVERCQPGKPIGRRKETERFRRFTYAKLLARDKASLDILWLKDDSLTNTENLPRPAVLAAQIVEDLQEALDEFAAVEKMCKY